MKRIFLFVYMATVFLPMVIFAQQNFDVTLSTSPEQALPYMPVTVSVDSVSIDLERATIVWSINGKTVKSGMGLKDVTFRAGKLGTTAVVAVTVATIDGGQFSASKTVYTTDADIVWEAYDSYVPPFYKGKALPADEANIKAVAIPSVNGFGATVKSKDFVYGWKRNYDAVAGASGAGKASFFFSLDYLNNKEKIGVDIGARSGTYSGVADADIVIVKPSINFYQKTTDGIIHFEKAINGGETLYGGSLLYAAPFGMSPKNPTDQALTYEWTVGGDTIEPTTRKNTISVDLLRGGVLDLLITNTDSLFQEVTKRLTIGS